MPPYAMVYGNRVCYHVVGFNTV